MGAERVGRAPGVNAKRAVQTQGVQSPSVKRSVRWVRGLCEVLLFSGVFVSAVSFLLHSAAVPPPERQVVPAHFERIAMQFPRQVSQGACAMATFSLVALQEKDKAHTEVHLVLRTPAGKEAKTVRAFALPPKGIAQLGTDAATAGVSRAGSQDVTHVALLGISIFWEPGDWMLEAQVRVPGGKPYVRRAPLRIEKKEFPREELRLDRKNTAIAQDKSERKKVQRERLKALWTVTSPQTRAFLGPFRQPVESRRCTSVFGQARVFVYTDGTRSAQYHWGKDFGVPVGTAVYAAGTGRVVLAEQRTTTGWSVVLEHAPGLYTAYYHLNELLVKKDTYVSTGTLIARSGTTGFSTGPHVHWEARINSTPIDPECLDRKSVV